MSWNSECIQMQLVLLNLSCIIFFYIQFEYDGPEVVEL